jgi:hypothetical protein
MKDSKDVVALVVDHGLFVPLARELGRKHFKKIYYHSCWERAFPQLRDCVIGDGYDEIERCDDPFRVLDEIDLAIFPDIMHSGWQEELEKRGIAVWGSRSADILETARQDFKKLQSKLGMDVPPHKAITGMSALREYLMENDDCFVKLDKYRGDMETWHHEKYALSVPKLDSLSVKFGPVSEYLEFLCEPRIKTNIEIGYDGYCIDGRFPRIGVQGYEAKDKGYLGTIQEYSKMPKQVTEVNEALASTLAEYSYRNFFSTEIRVKGDKNYLIDPCCRCPSPSTEAQSKLYGNLGDIIWYGANGEMIDPEPTAKFAAECILTLKGSKDGWRMAEVPTELDEWVMCGSSCLIDGRICFPSDGSDGDEAGWLVATGDTIEETIDTLKERCEMLSGSGFSPQPECLAGLLAQIKESESKGMEFTEQTIPKPETVLDL